jgi:hypothetical protein
MERSMMRRNSKSAWATVLGGALAIATTAAAGPPAVVTASTFLSGGQATGTGRIVAFGQTSAGASIGPTTRAHVGMLGALGYAFTATPCPGDVDDDGTVGFGDLLDVLAAWGACAPGPCPADVGGDGFVGFDDLVSILALWGPCP